jgi:hypothetical protein
MAARSNGRQIEWLPDYKSLQPSFNRVTDSGKYIVLIYFLLFNDGVCGLFGESWPLKFFPKGTFVLFVSFWPGPGGLA